MAWSINISFAAVVNESFATYGWGPSPGTSFNATGTTTFAGFTWATTGTPNFGHFAGADDFGGFLQVGSSFVANPLSTSFSIKSNIGNIKVNSLGMTDICTVAGATATGYRANVAVTTPVLLNLASTIVISTTNLFANDAQFGNVDEIRLVGVDLCFYFDEWQYDTVPIIPNTAPTISGAVAGHAINDTATVAPFSALTIVDANGDNVTTSVTLDLAAKGVFTLASLTASGFVDATGGVYTFALTTPALAQAAIRQLVYAPTTARVAATFSETTTFSVAVSDAVLTTTNNTTTVISTNNNIPDTTPPVVTAPNPITLVGDAVLGGTPSTDPYIVAFLGSATAVDNQDGNITPSHNAPALFGNATATTVVFSATDIALNTATANAIVTINDPNGVGGNALAASGTGLTINQSTNLGLDPNATTTDTDGDGLSDIIEVGNPALPLDSDGDAVLNVFEAGADATNVSIASGMLAGNNTVSVVSTGHVISNASASVATGTLPANTFFPLGIVNYQTTAPLGVYTLSLMFGSAIPATGLNVYMVSGGVYTALPGTAWTRVSSTQIDLMLTDGGVTDLDAVVNGVIVNSIGIGFLNTAPTFTGTPTISGTAIVGNILSINNVGVNDVDGDPVTLVYQWQSNGVDITGATGTIYTPTSAVAHRNITCMLTASDNRGGSVTATTAAVAVDNSAPSFITTPIIVGVANIGNTLNLTNTSTTDTDADTISLSYQWQADGVDIVGENAATYTLLAADLAKLITCNITANDGQAAPNSTLTVATASVTAVDNTPPVVTAPANITMEATGATTPVTLGSALVNDNVDVGLMATPSTTGPFAVGVSLVTWSVTDVSGNTGSAVQSITITDTTAPIVTIVGNSNITVTQGGTYTDAGATATDIVDGNISARIVTTGAVDTAIPGGYILLYKVFDTAGNLGVAVRSVVVTASGSTGGGNTGGGNTGGGGNAGGGNTDTTAPVMTLLGDSRITLAQGTVFTDPGATALDDIDGDVSSNITVSGVVDMTTPDIYVLVYSVPDTAGNLGVIARTVEVVRVRSTTFFFCLSPISSLPIFLWLLVGILFFRKKQWLSAVE